MRHVAATMMNLSKNPFEAEIDVVELIDFFRFNAFFYSADFNRESSSKEFESIGWIWRPLEGFVFAISPFNFYALGGNLSTTSAMLGNVVLWKPSTNAVFANYEIMKLLMHAGASKGCYQFCFLSR